MYLRQLIHCHFYRLLHNSDTAILAADSPPATEPLPLKIIATSLFALTLVTTPLYADVPPCPKDTHAEGAAPPTGLERKCVTANGLAEGPWLTWYSSGQLLSERTMKLGREHGRQRSWWPNGQLMMEGISYEGSRYKGFKYWSITGAPAELNIETQTVTKQMDTSQPPAPSTKP